MANEPPEAISDRAVRPVAPTSGNDLSATAAQMLACDREALAALIGEKHYLIGDKTCGSDAFVLGIVTSILTPSLDIPLRAAMQKHANLLAYRDRTTPVVPRIGRSLSGDRNHLIADLDLIPPASDRHRESTSTKSPGVISADR